MENKCLKNDTPPHVSRKSLPKIALPIIVEGRYDKITLTSLFNCRVIVTDGFGIFNSKEKQSLIRKVAAKGGIIVLTDSDGGGVQIRRFLSGMLPAESIHQLYIPEIEGKERRKTTASKAGLLGVEGMTPAVLYKVFSKYITNEDGADSEEFTVSTAELFALGLTGADSSSMKRDELSLRLGLPRGMTAKAQAAAIPMVMTNAEWELLKSEMF